MRKYLLGLATFLLMTAIGAKAQTASFVKTDISTSGSYTGIYGGDGYDLAYGANTTPAYAAVAITGEQDYTWATGSADKRSLNGNASAWYVNTGSYTIDLTISDGASHQVALYAVDWDNKNRAETIKITNPTTGAVLDTRSLSGFYNGVYEVWLISGNVRFTITQTSGDNAVVSGIFFGTTGGAAPSCPVVTHPVGLFWSVVTGATSYGVYRGTVSGGPYTLLGTVTTPAYSDSTIVAGSKYYYVTTATTAAGTSGYSPEAAVVTTSN